MYLLIDQATIFPELSLGPGIADIPKVRIWGYRRDSKLAYDKIQNYAL